MCIDLVPQNFTELIYFLVTPYNFYIEGYAICEYSLISSLITQTPFISFLNDFIYLFLAVLGLHCYMSFSVVVVSGGCSLVVLCRFSL